MALGIRYISEQEGGHQQLCGFTSHQSIVHQDYGAPPSLSGSANYEGSIVQKCAQYGTICQWERFMI